VRRLLADEGLRAGIGAAARRRARAFTASSVVPRIEAVYREVASG
jgi:glycosyltransferase involved in cell wall biosynthesis